MADEPILVQLADGTDRALVNADGSLTVALAGGAAAIGSVTVTDGADHTLPAGDAAARAIFTKHTDGTNTAPTMDAVARAGFVKLTDGTSTLPILPAEISVLASAERTTTQTQADQSNLGGRGIVVVLDMTVVGTGSVTLTIQGKDAVSGKYYTLLTGAAVTTDSTNVYRVYPGLTAAANAVASDVLPRTWRVVVTAGNANPATYSVGAIVLP